MAAALPQAAGEPPRVQPSKRRRGGGDSDGEKASASSGGSSATGRRKSSQPLIVVAKAAHTDEALAGLERWKARHPAAAALLQDDDVLVDSMRGRSSTWTRIRVNLRHVPEAERPAEEPPDPDYDPWRGFRPPPRAARAAAARSADEGDADARDDAEAPAAAASSPRAPSRPSRAPKTRSSS